MYIQRDFQPGMHRKSVHTSGWEGGGGGTKPPFSYHSGGGVVQKGLLEVKLPQNGTDLWCVDRP